MNIGFLLTTNFILPKTDLEREAQVAVVILGVSPAFCCK